jgi:hypothetical protein
MAYTNDFTTDAGNYNVGVKILDQEITLVRYFDCTTRNLGSGEYSKLWSVPAGFQLTKAYAVCIATESSDTFDIVDDDSATTTFINDADMSAIGTVTANTADKYYASAGYICILANAALTTAKFYVVVKGIILNTSM